MDRTTGGAADGHAFAALGLEVEVSTVMTATAVHEPSRPNLAATYRPLETDADWEQQVELSMVGEEIGYDREFCEARARQHRRMVEAGHGQWWGAYVHGELLSSMGLFTASPGLARFQNVKTHPDARGQGLAGTLVHRTSRFGFDELGATTLVMVADPDYLAIRVYRSVGFSDGEVQVGATRRPPD
jgi:predicted GNAT family acetyltransferase